MMHARRYPLLLSIKKEKVPLLFNLHGFTGTSTSQLNYADFRDIADEEKFILVYPQGTLLDGRDTHWNVGSWTLSSTTDDVEFFDMLIADLAENYNIDLDRVYATGHSNGGYMSFLLACQMLFKPAVLRARGTEPLFSPAECVGQTCVGRR